MAESLLDTLIARSERLAQVYSTVKLADQGVAPATRSQTNGAANPVIQQGGPADVMAGDSVLAAIAESAQKAYTARTVDRSLPMIIGAIVGVLALVYIVRSAK